MTITIRATDSMTALITITRWPDLTIDQQAWELAKIATGPDAIISEVNERACRIKSALLDGSLAVEEYGESDMEMERRTR